MTADRERLLARLLAERGITIGAPTIPARPPGAVVPLTPAQRRLWFLDRLGEAGTAYLVVGSYRLTGALDPDRLAEALRLVVRRHEALRTRIVEQAGGPVQVVDDAAEPVLLLGEPAGLWRPFALDRAPLLRAALDRLGPDRHVLTLVAHHIVCDDRSLSIVLRDLLAAYRGEPLPALPVAFGDYACWLAGRPAGDPAAEEYWVRELAGAPALLDLPTDRPRPPAPSGAGATVGCPLPGVAELAAATGCTPFMILLAAFGAVLGRLADTDDVLIGAAVSNRDAPELAGLVGMFVNTVVLRVDLSGDPTFRQLLERVRAGCVTGLAHGDVPLDRVVELVNPDRAAGRNPLFQVMLVVNPAPPAGDPDLAVEPAGAGAVPARFDLTLVATQSQDGVRAQLDYATDLFDEPTVARLGALLRTVLRTPDARVWRIPLVEPATFAALAGTTPAPPFRPVLELIAEQARRAPEAPAVFAHDGTLGYGELHDAAGALAGRLRALGVGPGTVVGLAAPAGAHAITGLLGVLRAGGAYLPLDPEQPARRRLALLADAAAPVLLTVTAHRHDFDGYPGRVLCLDRPQPGDPPDHSPAAADPAYLIYTSGSTGTPKGVAVSHAALANLARTFADRHGLGAGDRLLMVPPLWFDASVGDIFPALISGAALVLPAEPAALNGPDLMTLCAEHGVTAVDTASAIWQCWVTQLDGAHRPAPSLRLMMVGGERVPAELVRIWAERTGNAVELVNHYGPTEATVCATTYGTRTGAELTGAELPIGRPLPGVRAYVLDRRLSPLPPGVPGELYLGGAALATGYRGRPGLTAERFRPDPFGDSDWGGRMYRTGDRARYRADGELEFLGRTDRQVKIRGNRVELGEIESALAAHAQVRDAVVIADGTPARLLGYVTPAAGDPDPAGLRRWLAARLPGYLVPDAVLVLEALPLNRNGKVDTAALPRPDSARPAFTAPRDAVEIRLAELWAGLLEAENIGADDDFFALGGHSLLIPSVVAGVRAAFGVSVSARSLLESPRLADFAAVVRGRCTGTATEPQAVPDVSTLRADARLPAGLCFDAPDAGPGAVFLTGATGMLGVRLLADLLAHTDAEVRCLVRTPDLTAAMERRGLWRPEFARRLVAVAGDLTAPRFGLPARKYDELAAAIGVIYHSAALINVLYPYRRLRPVNVAGTLEVLRLAAHRRRKPVHFVSTLGVFFGAALAGRVVREHDEPTDPTGIGSTFATSKWVADGLVRAARDRGLPASVYRLARVTGDSVTGESKTDDLFCRTVSSYVQLGCAPAGGELDILPVDHLARSIGALSRQGAGSDHHLRGSAALSQHDLIAAINEFGHPVDTVEPGEFWARAGAAIDRGADLGLAPFAGIASLPTGSAAPVFDCTHTERTLAGIGLPHPVPDAGLIHRYLEYFVRAGRLPAPAHGPNRGVRHAAFPGPQRVGRLPQ